MGKRRRSTLQGCRFSTPQKKASALRRFLREYGDGLPAEAVKKAVAKDALPTWSVFCDEKGVTAAMRYEHNDWYLCTVKNAAVRPDQRGKGYGSMLYQETVKNALQNESCKVLAADVTSSNTPSVKALERAGFKKVNEFCWAEGEKPADIVQFVRLPVSARGTCPSKKKRRKKRA